MRRLLLVDLRNEFVSLILSKCLIEEDLSFEIVSTLNDTSNLMNAINTYNPDEIIVCDNIALSQPNWNFNKPVRGYFQDDVNKSDKLLKAGIVSVIPHGNNITNFIDSLNKGVNLPLQNGMEQTPLNPVQNYSQNQNQVQNPVLHSENIYERENISNPVSETFSQGNISSQGLNPEQMRQMDFMNNQNVLNQSVNYNTQPEASQSFMQGNPQLSGAVPGNTGMNNGYNPYGYPVNSYSAGTIQTPVNGYPNQQSVQQPQAYQPNAQGYYNQQGNIPAESLPQSQSDYNQSGYNQNGYVQPGYMPPQGMPATPFMAGNNIPGYMMPQQEIVKPAEIITVHSAKGGVGKTTIASSLAVLLSMVDNGKNKLRVCIVDYDVDYGDVATILDEFDVTKSTMKDWQIDINGRITQKQAQIHYPDAQARMDDLRSIAASIKYTKEEVERFLQPAKSTQLKGLIAPISIIDSNNYSGYDYEIMLRNIKECGAFDYIICDTSNSIKNEATLTAIEMCDKLFLINDQDVNTVNCNNNLLRVLKNNLPINTGKISIVLNKLKNAKEVDIAPSEIEKTFVEYPCIAKFIDDTMIQKMNNNGRSVAFDENNRFTKELKNIICIIRGEVPAITTSTKKKLFFR